MLFHVRLVADAQALSRLLEHFALRLLLPGRVVAQIDGGSFDVVLEVPDIDEATAHLISEKIRSSVLTIEVALSSLSAQPSEGVAS